MTRQRLSIFARAIQIVDENNTRAAIEASECDNLPRLGQPAAIWDDPYDPFWWIRRKLARERLPLREQTDFGDDIAPGGIYETTLLG
jgi:hypothetical protein